MCTWLLSPRSIYLTLTPTLRALLSAMMWMWSDSLYIGSTSYNKKASNKKVLIHNQPNSLEIEHTTPV